MAGMKIRRREEHARGSDWSHINNVNTKGETRKFAKYLTKDLKNSGITMDPDASQ